MHAIDRDGDGDQDILLGSFGMGWSLFGADAATSGLAKMKSRVCDEDQLLWLENLGSEGEASQWAPKERTEKARLQREVQALKTITENDPTNVTFRMNLGNALIQSGQTSQAHAVLKNAVTASPQEALSVFQEGCRTGQADACTNLGVLYFYGDGVTKDLALSAQYYQQACDGGEGNACANLALMYQSGQGVARDTEKAIRRLRSACDHHQMGACGQLGELHLSGEGVTQDSALARRLLHQACVGGDAPSCQTLAGVSGGKAPAEETMLNIRALEASCEKGQAGPCRVLADRYAQGLGLAPDMARAVGYAEKACSAGDAVACGNAGGAYLEGVAGKKDPDKARILFQKACKGGISRACDFLKSVTTAPEVESTQ